MSITKMFSVDSNFLLEQFHVGRGCDKKKQTNVLKTFYSYSSVFIEEYLTLENGSARFSHSS